MLYYVHMYKLLYMMTLYYKEDQLSFLGGKPIPRGGGGKFPLAPLK